MRHAATWSRKKKIIDNFNLFFLIFNFVAIIIYLLYDAMRNRLFHNHAMYLTIFTILPLTVCGQTRMVLWVHSAAMICHLIQPLLKIFAQSWTFTGLTTLQRRPCTLTKYVIIVFWKLVRAITNSQKITVGKARYLRNFSERNWRRTLIL